MANEQRSTERINEPTMSGLVLFGSIAATFVVMITVVLQASAEVMAWPLLAAIGAG